MGEAAVSQVGGYRVVRKLAIGGMAEIYLARLEGAHGFKKNVVLKRILPRFMDDPRFVRMFLDEARLAARLTHAHIAQVFDIGEVDGRPFYAMEYVEGQDLRQIAKRAAKSRQMIPLDVVVGVAAGIAAGLHHAHAARDEQGQPLQIVHRDVTPSNVIVTYDGVPKLLDFGVAKAALHDREETATGILKGKVPYMSPEQVRGEKDLDGRSDIFSLGTILWELTTMRRLFRADSPAATIHKIAFEDVQPPSELLDGYAPELERIVLKCLARDRDQRYANALDVQRDLEEFAVEARLRTGATHLARYMHEVFEAELRAIELELTSQDREHTDSELLTTPLVGSPEPTPTDDPSRGAATPVAVTAVEPTPGPASRAPIWIGASIAIVGLLAVGAISSRGAGSPAPAPAEPAAPAAARDALAGAPVTGKPVPGDAASTAAGGEVDPPAGEAPPTAEEAPEVQAGSEEPVEAEPPKDPVKSTRPEKSTKSNKSKGKKPATKSESAPPQPAEKKEWNKNSIALPD